MRGYYSVPQVLDVDRYPIDGSDRATRARGPRARPDRPPDGQHNWTNLHTVYTHGYGMIAAYGNQRQRNDKPVTSSDGEPVWAEQDLPPQGVLTDMSPERYQPRIYFGENSPAYSIVGKAPGGTRRRARPAPRTQRAGAADQHLRPARAACRSAASSTSCCTP